jgi:hypothetical protein
MSHVSLLRRRAEELLCLALMTENLSTRTMLLNLSSEMTAEAVRLEAIIKAAATTYCSFAADAPSSDRSRPS